MHKRTHHRRVRDCRLIFAGGAAAQPGERVAAVVIVVVGARRVVVRAGSRARGYAVGRSVLGRRRREGEEMMTGAAATVTRQTSSGGRQRGSQRTLRLLVAHGAARGRRRRESPGLRGVRATAGQPRMENRAVKVRPADLAYRTARHAAARHPCVGVVCGRGCGVMRRRSGVGIVTPVVAGVADHPGHPGAPRRRLQRRPRRLVPSSGARLAAHVHSAIRREVFEMRRDSFAVEEPRVGWRREDGRGRKKGR